VPRARVKHPKASKKFGVNKLIFHLNHRLLGQAVRSGTSDHREAIDESGITRIPSSQGLKMKSLRQFIRNQLLITPSCPVYWGNFKITFDGRRIAVLDEMVDE
jgi:hypothetical protein